MSETPQEIEQEEVDATTATPAAEAKAEELGVPVEEVEGSGVEGRVLVSDVEEHAATTDAGFTGDEPAVEGEDVARHVHPDDGGYQYTGE